MKKAVKGGKKVMTNPAKGYKRGMCQEMNMANKAKPVKGQSWQQMKGIKWGKKYEQY